jgi:hypothetical protein
MRATPYKFLRITSMSVLSRYEQLRPSVIKGSRCSHATGLLDGFREVREAGNKAGS